MATQLLNAAALIAAMEQRANEYDQFLTSLERLQDAIEGVLNLDRSVFDGEAATMIRAFFSDQQLLVAGWVTLAEVQAEFFRGVHGKLSDLDLDGQTRVSVPFLDEEIRHSQESLKGLIRAQQDSLATILSGIDDLVSITPYDESGLIDGTRRAEDIRNKTLSNLHAADTELANEYVLSEDQLASVQGMITNYLQAITVNPDTQTIVYDTNAFHNGEAVQQRVEVEQRAAEYVEFKDEQHKQREAIAKAEAEQEALDNRSGWEKAWDGTVNVLAEVSGYNDASRAITGTDPVTGEELSWAERIKAGAMAAAGFIPVVGTGARLGATALRTADKAMDLAKGSHYVGAFHNSQKGLDLMKTAEYGLYGTATSLGLGEYMTGRDIFGNELTDEQRNNSLTQSLFIMGGGAVTHHADKLAGANAAFKTTGQQANTLLNRGVMHSQQFLRGVANDHRQAYNALKSGTQTAAQRIQQSLTPGGQQLAMAGGGRMSPDLGVRKEDVVVRSSKGTEKSNLKLQFTKEQLATKPLYSPAPDKWIKKGGTVKIDEDGTWVYTNKEEQVVRYPDGYPDFTRYSHPTILPVEIEIASPTNRQMDYKKANLKAGLNKNSNPPVPALNKPPAGYIWHHHQDGKTMILVNKDIHSRFTHAGGVSIINGK